MFAPTLPSLSPAEAVRAQPPRLTRPQLHAAELATGSAPRLRYDLLSRLLFGFIDLVYGRRGSVLKFHALELMARVPYQTWERVAYRSAGRLSSRTGLARSIQHRIVQSRAQQDNEQWHLFVLDEILRAQGTALRPIRDRVLPRVLAGIYHPFTWLVFVLRPEFSYRLNAYFEDHAEHEYMQHVTSHPELDAAYFASELNEVFGHVTNIGDVLRQIGHDERSHKDESLVEALWPQRSSRGLGGSAIGPRPTRHRGNTMRSSELSTRSPGHAPRSARPHTASGQPTLVARALTGPTGSPARRIATNAALLGGAALVASSGLIHLYLWADGYRNVATVGQLFLAQGIAGLLLAVALMAYPRVLTAGAAAAYLLATIAGLALSATHGLFGFMDTLAAPLANTSLIVESVGAVLLIVGGALLFPTSQAQLAGPTQIRTRKEQR
jgi:ubiquinol oxidase